MGKRKFAVDETAPKKAKLHDANFTEEMQPQDFQPQNVKDMQERSSNKQSKKNKFDAKHFRKELTSKNGQTIALTQFLQVCLDPDSDADYMVEYLNAGGNSHEILRQLSSEAKKNLTLATPVFHIFHLIILKVQSSFPQMISITEEASRYFLNNFMPTVEIMISENSGPRHKKIILKLFTSMVTLNPDLGIEILNQAPLTPKHLQHILEKPNYKEKDNVRTAFVHFMTSFLIDSHFPLIKALLEKQGLLSLVIPGLIQDEAEAVLMFLNILKKNVIENLLISKSLKLKTFSHNVLHQMFRLYYWKGPPDTDHEIINQFKPEITSLVSAVILTLFTSSKLGLYFTDTTLGTTDANKNQNLYKALLSLKRPWEHEKQSETILEIIYKCPDLHRAVINLIEQNFEPQHSQIWEKSINYIVAIYEKFKPESMVPKLKNLKTQQAVNFIRFVTLPVPLLKHLTNALNKTDISLSIHCIKILVKMLASLKRYFHLLEMDSTDDLSVELKNKLEYFFPKHLPLPSVIVNLIHQCLSDYPQSETDKKEYEIPKIDKVDSLILLIDLLLHYHDIHPAYIESLEGNLNLKEILDYSLKVNNRNVALLKFKVVSLWLCLDSSAASLQNPMFRELFQILLDVYTNDGDQTWRQAKETVYNFFKSTNIFESDHDEIHIMLYAIRNCCVDSEIIGDIVKYVLENNETLAEYLRAQIANLDLSEKQSEANLEKLFDDLSTGKNLESNTALDTKMPSQFIVGCRHYIKANKHAKKKLKPFLNCYISNLLHLYFSTELTETVIGDAKLDVHTYVAKWATQPTLLDASILCNDETLLNLSRFLISEEFINLQDIFTFVKLSTDDNFDFKFLDSPYVFVNEDVDVSKMLVWSKYLIFCFVRFAELTVLDETKKSQISEVLEVILEFCNQHHMTHVSRNIILSLFKCTQLVKLYSPVEQKVQSHAIASEFLINIAIKYTYIVDYLIKKHNIFKILQQKNCTELLKTFNKAKKKKDINTETLVKCLEVIGLLPNDNTRIMKHVFECDVANFIKDDKEPSFILETLRSIITKYSEMPINFTANQLNQIMSLYTKLLINKEVAVNLTSTEDVLIKYFENKPHHCKTITDDIFKQFFYAPLVLKSSVNLAKILLKCNSKLCHVFLEELNRPEVLSQRELTLPLGEAMLEHRAFVLKNTDQLNKIYEEYKSNIFKVIEKPHKAGQVYVKCWRFIKKLLVECASVEDCIKIFNKTHKFEVVDDSHTCLFNAAFIKLCLNPEKLKTDYVVNYFLSIMHLITFCIKESKDEKLLDVILFETYDVYKALTFLNKDLAATEFKKLTESGIWLGFCKAVLRYSLKMKTEEDNSEKTGSTLLYIFTKLLQMFYPDEHEDFVTLFDMATSHSEFLKVMLSHNSPEIKSRLLQFLYVVMKKNKSVMKQQQIPVYLSAYEATKSPCDRQILTILHFYETCGLPIQEYKPYLWGESAANFYAVRKNRTASLWSQPTPNQIINLFDKEKIDLSLRLFDVYQKLDYCYEPPSGIDDRLSDSGFISDVINRKVVKCSEASDVETAIRGLLQKSKHESKLREIRESELTTISHKESDCDIYDPAFVLPLLSHMLAPGSVASCFKLLRKGLLSIPVMALSSTCPLMRAAAYHVLHRFSLLLETESKHKNDKLLLSDFIDTLRNSLKSAIIKTEDIHFDNLKNPRLPAIDALYLAKALIVSTAPFEPVYKPVNNFFIAKQQIDLTVVPDFLSLFHDCDVEFADRRNWILNIMRYGTKSIVDVNVVFKTMCLKMLMDYYSSVLCDRKGKIKILGVLDQMLSVPRASDILIEGYGLTSWLHGVIHQLGPEDKSLFKLLLQIFQTLLQSMQINGFANLIAVANKSQKPLTDVIKDFKVNKDLEHVIVHLLTSLLNYVEFVEIDDFIFYIKTLNLVSKKGIRILNNKGLINIVHKCSVFRVDSNILDLLSTAISSNSVEILLSKLLILPSNSDDRIVNLLKELVTLIKSFLA